MFSLAFYIGIFSYLIFALGLLNLLYTPIILTSGFIFIIIVLYLEKKHIRFLFSDLFSFISNIKTLERVLVLLIALQIIANLFGVLGPELGFDALWYHLTLPKIYLINHKIFHIPGSLLYYTDMPKLTEMIYIFGLALGSEIYAKIIHFLYGVLILIALYKLSRKFFNQTHSLLIVIIFYSNLVVGWMSISAYIDLSRTFFELVCFWAFLNWIEKKKAKWLIESSCLLGLAISAKLLAIGSLVIFITIITVISKNKIKDLLMFIFLSLIVPLPWFVFSYINNKNPVYPFFTQIYPIQFRSELFNPLQFVKDVFLIFAKSSDPINPIFLLLLPLVIFYYKKFRQEIKIISLYSLLSIIIWYITPRTGGGRFILAYLPIFSILSVSVLKELKKTNLQRIFLVLIIFFSLFSIIYRLGANSKYIPVLFGLQSKSDFLANHLNFSFGDFYDIDGYFKQNIKPYDTVLLYGFHNLYYVDFPFIDSSWVKKGDEFNCIATQKSNLPNRFNNAKVIYENKKTNVRLYSLGGQKWVY